MRTTPTILLGSTLLFLLVPHPGRSTAVATGSSSAGAAQTDCARRLRDAAQVSSCLSASSVPLLGALFPLSEELFVDAATGNVGVGTLQPASALEVRADEEGGPGASAFGGRSSFLQGGTGLLAEGGVGSSGGNGLQATGGAANQGDGGRGVVGTGGSGFDGFGGTGVVGVAGQGGLGPGFGLFAFGDLGATGTKSFVQPHPHDPSKEIRFVSLEGNESGTYFRGSGRLVGGRAVIDVPEEFRLVTSEAGLTAQVTPVGELALVAVERLDLHQLVVLGDRDVAFDYFVNGVRRGFEDHSAVVANRTFVPQVRGEPYGAALPEPIRRTLVSSGILNEDFTPDEATARRMGWRLRDPE